VGAAKKTENQRRWEEVHREVAKSRRGKERDEEDEEDKEIEQAEVEGKAKAKLAPRTTRPTTELELD
jgi:predicted phage gp36 major capsid-like protein